MVEKLEPVPEDGLPPEAVHANVLGKVPPEPVALQDTAVPTTLVAGQLTDTVKANGLIVTVAESVAVWEALSVNVTVIV